MLVKHCRIRLGWLPMEYAAPWENDKLWFLTQEIESMLILFPSLICFISVLVTVRANSVAVSSHTLRPLSTRRWLDCRLLLKDWPLDIWRKRKLLSTETALWRNPVLKTIMKPPAGPSAPRGILRNENIRQSYQLSYWKLPGLQSARLIQFVFCFLPHVDSLFFFPQNFY